MGPSLGTQASGNARFDRGNRTLDLLSPPFSLTQSSFSPTKSLFGQPKVSPVDFLPQFRHLGVTDVTWLGNGAELACSAHAGVASRMDIPRCHPVVVGIPTDATTRITTFRHSPNVTRISELFTINYSLMNHAQER